jgi:glycosyltransferase involved in cell wall biosynthesis
MHILLAHNEYGVMSGEEQSFRDLAGLLTDHGHKVSWFLRSSTEICHIGHKVAAFLAGIHSFKSERRMHRQLTAETPDIVEVQSLYPFLSPSILSVCHKHRVPLVMLCPNYRLFCPSGLHLSHGETCERCLGGKEYWCVLRNCEADYFKSLGYALRNAAARVTRRILDNVHVFIVLTRFQKQRFIESGIEPDRIEILPNIAKPVEGSPCDIPGDLVTFVGRASAEKGIEDFVAAARLLPEIPFAVAGSTQRMPWLVKSSPKNLKWVGFLQEKELNDFYLQSRIAVTPSRCFEGFPNSVAQAMVMGKPVVASRIGALPEIVDEDRTGLLFQMRNVGDLAGKIKSLYYEPARCMEMGRAGRSKALVEYSSEFVYQRLMQIYEKARRAALA